MTDTPEPGSREEAAQRRNMGAGPFRTAGPVVIDAEGRPFVTVEREECVGGDLSAAKARATRIAEALNLQGGHGKPAPYVDDQGNLRAPAGYGFVAKGQGCEMVPLVSISFGPTG